MFPILSGYPTSIGSAGLYASGGHSPSCVSSGRLGESHARASVACLFLSSRLVAAVLFCLTPLITSAALPSSWLASCCDCVARLLMPCVCALGNTGNSEWAYRRDTQRFMVAWVGDRPRWPSWLPEAAGAIPLSRRSPEQYSESIAEWLLRRQQGEERSEVGREGEEASATGGPPGTGGIGSKAPHH